MLRKKSIRRYAIFCIADHNSPEVKERAVRMVFDQQAQHESQWSAISSIASKIDRTRETLRTWVRQAERDAGKRAGLTTDERQRLKELERENRELKRANETLRVAWGDDRLATNYHAGSPDQRWAYDLVVEPAMHGSENPEDYGCYGTPVVAPVSARVQYSTDGAPDHKPGSVSMDRANPSGNVFVLALEIGTYLVIAHLQSGRPVPKLGPLEIADKSAA